MNLYTIKVIDENQLDLLGEVNGCETFFMSSKKLTVTINGFNNGIICRVSPPKHNDVVQLGVGKTASSLCNALYSSELDTALEFAADDMDIMPMCESADTQSFKINCLGPLTITTYHEYYKVYRGIKWFKPMNRMYNATAPVGWCSYHADMANETANKKSTDWMAENLKKFGLEYVQIDAEWMYDGKGWHGSARNHHMINKNYFPNGMKYMADYIQSKGFKAGIWCCLWGLSNDDIHRHNKGAFVHNKDGSSPGRLKVADMTRGPQDIWVHWLGEHLVDSTSEDGQQYLINFIKIFCEKWGYKYIKIDFQEATLDFYKIYNRYFADPSLGYDKAFRLGWEAIRSAAGSDCYLLCCAHGFESCGFADGIRTGNDVLPFPGCNIWETIKPTIDSTMRWLFLNTIAFYTDPDAICVRNRDMSYDIAQLWSYLIGITGQTVMLGDRLIDDISEDRVDLLRRIMPVADIHPMELYPLNQRNIFEANLSTDFPHIFDLKVNLINVGSWDVIAVFNWNTEKDISIELTPEKLGLKAGKWIVVKYPVKDLFKYGPDGQIIHHGDGNLILEVKATSCIMVSYWADEGKPRFIGTSRHLTQGAVDMVSVKWDEEKLHMSGISKVVGGDPYHIRMYVPRKYYINREKSLIQHDEYGEFTVAAPERTLESYYKENGDVKVYEEGYKSFEGKREINPNDHHGELLRQYDEQVTLTIIRPVNCDVYWHVDFCIDE